METAAYPKVLVVGAGGIGCEVLKNLVLSHFPDIEVVDMDTIELSNLNRQFLFRRRHIGCFKSEVAAEAVRAMNPAAKVVAHVGNIMDTAKFPMSFFQRFGIVLNALDNLGARRYVNNMCLALGIPLVESGTAGYLGQCTVILPRRTECYDCTGKETPKTFPVCTIRSTPSIPLHCVVWAKEYLLPNLFGEQPDEAIPEDIEDRSHAESLQKETEAFKHLREMAKVGDADFGRAIFNKVFYHDIEAIRGISALWESRPAPVSLVLRDLTREQVDLSALNDQDVWSVEAWSALLLDSAQRLRARAYTTDPATILSFDKDDRDTLDFVAAVANLRAAAYGIPLTSLFALKAMAGNIIPAIATTNAIAAGMVVLQAKNILAGKQENLCDSFITFDASRKDYFIRSNVVAPSPACKTCFVHRGLVQCNPAVFKLGDVIEKVVAGRFLAGLADPSVTTEGLSILEGNRLIYDEEDFPASAAKALAELAIKDSMFIRLEFLEGLPLVLAIQSDDSYAEGEFGLKLDILPPEQVRLAAKRHHDQQQDDDNSSDLEICCPGDDESDFEILEPPAVRVCTA